MHCKLGALPYFQEESIEFIFTVPLRSLPDKNRFCFYQH